MLLDSLFAASSATACSDSVSGAQARRGLAAPSPRGAACLARRRYSGDLVRDDSVAFIRGHAGQGAPPFMLYVPFQECHDPYQVRLSKLRLVSCVCLAS